MDWILKIHEVRSSTRTIHWRAMLTRWMRRLVRNSVRVLPPSPCEAALVGRREGGREGAETAATATEVGVGGMARACDNKDHIR